MMEGGAQADLEMMEVVRKSCLKLVTRFLKDLRRGGLVDENLVDQLVIFMALATSGFGPSGQCNGSGLSSPGICRIFVGNISTHARTAMIIAEKILGNIRFLIESIGDIGEAITCQKKGA